MVASSGALLVEAMLRWVALLLWPVMGLGVGWCLWALLRPSDAAVPVGWLAILGLGVLVWVGVLLALAGAFVSWLLVLLLLLPMALLICRALRRRASLGLPRVTLPARHRPVAAAALIVTLAAFCLASPAESFVVTDDAGVYTLGAIHLVRSGGLSVKDADLYPLQTLPNDVSQGDYYDYLQDYARQFLLPENVSVPAATRFWGPFFQPVLYRHQIEIGYLPVTKVLGAGPGLVLGLRWVIWAGPAMALLSLTLFTALLRRSLGWGVALPAGAMLAFAFPQVWFGRHLLSEPVTQALVMAILWLDAESGAIRCQGQRRLLTAAQALLLGLLPLTRLEGALIGGALLGWLVWHAQAKPGREWVWAGIALGFGQALSVLSSPTYLYTRLIGVLSQAVQPLAAAISIAVVALVAISACAPLRRRCLQIVGWIARPVHRSWVSSAFAIVLAAAVLVQAATAPLGDTFAGWLVQYWSLPALLFSLIGLVLAPLALPTDQRAIRALALLGVTFGLLYAVDAQTTPVHPWVMRRAVPMIIPALAMGAAVAAKGLVDLLCRRVLPYGGGCLLRGIGYQALVVALVIATGVTSLPLLIHQERLGVWTKLAAVDALLPSHAVVLIDDGAIGRQVAQPLALIYGHSVYHLQQSEALRADAPPVSRLLRIARSQGRPIYYLASDINRRLAPADNELSSVGGVHVVTPVLAHRTDGPPDWFALARQSFLIDVYELQENTSPQAAPVSGHVPLGVGSYPYLLSGFYGYEYDAVHSRSFRWAAGEASIHLPWPNANGASSPFDVRITVASPRPAGEPASEVELWAEGQRLLRAILPTDGSLVELHAAVPRLVSAGEPSLEIRLLADTYVPAVHGGSSDSRELGVRLFELSVEYPEVDP